MGKISQAAIDLIVREEVSSKDAYNLRYTRPIWPGASSGVTIGIGYDVGYSDHAKLEEDWRGKIPDAMIDALSSAVGVKGAAAKALAPKLRTVIVPWEAAMAAFQERDIPKWIRAVETTFPNCEKLTPDCLGALVSLCYNRGTDLRGDRRKEMAAIRAHMAAGHFDAIPAEFRAMKRLWPDLKGLRDRREREAALFEQGLRKPSVPAPVQKPVPRPIPPPPDIEPIPPKAPADNWLVRLIKAIVAIFRGK